jgi:hypothetical protein
MFLLRAYYEIASRWSSIKELRPALREGGGLETLTKLFGRTTVNRWYEFPIVTKESNRLQFRLMLM